MKKTKKLILILFSFLVLCQSGFGQDDILFRKYVLRSGFNGFLYGASASYILGLDGPATAGISVATGGTFMLVPALFSTQKTISFSEQVLRGHGSSLGWVHAFGLSALAFGEDAFSNDDLEMPKITLAVGMLGSIGGGILGRSLAKNHDWSDGRVELYRHYGWLMPYTGFSLMAAFSDKFFAHSCFKLRNCFLTVWLNT